MRRLHTFAARTLLAAVLAAALCPPAALGQSSKSERAWGLYNEAQQLSAGNEDAQLRALEKYGQALALFRAAGDSEGIGTVLFWRARVYRARREYKKAVDDNKGALSVFERLNNTEGRAYATNNIGEIYLNLGENATALPFYLQAVQLFHGLGNKVWEAETSRAAGMIYVYMNRPRNALRYLDRALTLFVDVKDRDGEARAVNNLAMLHDSMGNMQLALDYYFRALKLSNNGIPPGDGTVLMNISTAYLRQGKYDDALTNLTLALPTFRSSGYWPGEAQALELSMDCWRAKGNPRVAIVFGKKAVNLYQEIRGKIKDFDEETRRRFLSGRAPVYNALAQLLIELGRLWEAQQVLGLLKEEEFFDFVRRDPDEAAALSKDIALSEPERKAFAEYARLADDLTRIGARFQALFDKRGKAGGTLPQPEEDEYQQAKRDVEAAAEGFQKFLARLSDEFTKKVEDDVVVTPQTVEALRSNLRRAGTDVVLVSTFLSPERYRAIVMTGRTAVDRKFEFKDAGMTAFDLNRKIEAFQSALKNPSVDPRPLGKELYDILVAPIEKDIEGSGAKTLLWSLAGALRYIPVAALSPDGEHYLAERYRNVLVTLGRQGRLFEEAESDWRALGLGVSKKYEGFSELPAVTRELRSIVREREETEGVLPGRRLLDADFRAQVWRDLLPQESPDGKKFNVVHLATHFKLGADNRSSVLLLGDGTHLSLYELGKDEALGFENVELLTLSACETAVAIDEGSGGEVESLGMLAQEKGAKSVLATLWKVADESTQLLMTDFYRIRKERPEMTKAEAIQQAQIDMLEGRLSPAAEESRRRAELASALEKAPKDSKPFAFNPAKPYAHPYFWSPFVLIGNWR
ncbi:MAG TPA: CHAT domain-containing protein [Pyrinomonadaceae bacterium]|nr:CHAT domain-containing protein [Pyrinomonadaceae bacterium]